METFVKKHPITLAMIIAALFITGFSTTRFLPPGTIEVKDIPGLYIDKTEVLNADWTEYLAYLKNRHGENSNEYRSAFPDSLIWHTVYPLGKIGSLHTPSANFPVVGITHEQAVSYCNWRSDRVNEKYKKSVIYRLPTREEWDRISKSIVSEKDFSFQCKLAEANRKSNRVINMQDNVSEMLAEKGLAKGMNWIYLDTVTKQITYSDTFLEIPYHAPANYIGFRCVAIVN